MLFSVDESRYRIVDLSLRVAPPGTEGRPLQAERGVLPDRSTMHVVHSHTHVGTHVESPSHFFDGARRIEDFPLDTFYGRAVLFDLAGIDREPVGAEALEADIGSIMRPGDIVCLRNSHPDWRRVHGEDRNRLPWLAPDGCRWLVERRAKLIVIDDFCGIRLADDFEMSRENHAIFFEPGREVLLLEGADGLEQLTRKEFFFMALPLKFHELDSAWTRAVAIEER